MELCGRDTPEIRATKTVEWKRHKDFLANGVRDLFLNEYEMDTNVTFKGEVLRVHRLIMALFLPTFKRSLDEASSDGGNLREVNLNCIADRTEDVRALIEFVYTGKMTVSEGRLGHLTRLAKDLSFDGLAEALDECEPSIDVTSDDNDVGRPRRTKSAAVAVKVERDSEDNDADEEEEESDEEEEEEEEEDEEDDDNGNDELSDNSGSEYRPSEAEDDSNNEGKGRCTKRARGNVSRTKIIEDVHSAEVDQEALDRYCEEVFKSLELGHQQPEQPTSKASKPSKDVATKKSRKQPQPRRKPAPIIEKAAPKMKKEAIGALCKCGNCGREFLNNIPLRHHLKTCGFSLQVACRFCDHKAASRVLLRRHLFDAHRREMAAERRNRVNHIKCPEPLCKYSCVDPLRLKQHTQRMHSNDKKFKCHECAYAGVCQSELTIHITLCHLKQKNFMCDHCGTRFATKSGLNNHVRSTHQGYKNYKCEHCGKEFTSSSCYKIHVQSKHNVGGGLEMQVCDVCGKSYTRRSSLQLHTRRVHKTNLESLLKVHAPRRKDSQEGNGGTSSSQQLSDNYAMPTTAPSTEDGVCQGQVVERHATTSSQPASHHSEFLQATGSTFVPNVASSWFVGVDGTAMARQYQFAYQ